MEVANRTPAFSLVLEYLRHNTQPKLYIRLVGNTTAKLSCVCL